MPVRTLVSRRRFLGLLAAAPRRIQTVTGPIAPNRLGATLMHEHVIVDFGGTGRYDPDEAFAAALPHLKELRTAGCRTLVEPTPEHIGRDAALLRRLSRASGLHIVCATGIYGAANHKFVPAFARSETAEQLAARYEAEFRRGIGTTGIRPGIIKTGVNRAPLPEIERKLVRAAALASKATGLRVASHTGTGPAALEQLDLLAAAGVPASSFIWVHAQNEKDHEFHRKAAGAGAWVEFDGIREASLDWHVECVKFMKQAGFLNRTLISQDAGWYHVGEPKGGTYRGYTLLFREFLPRLSFSRADVDQLLLGNPREALSPTA
jgi:phosphotriesterase-related protein